VARKTSFDRLTVDSDDCRPTVSDFVRDNLWDPLKLFCTEPIVFFVAIMGATVNSIVYLFAEALSMVYVEGFGMGARPASLVNLALSIGVAFTFLPRIYDLYHTKTRAQPDSALEPEDKLFGFFVAAPVFAIGLWWFGFTVPPLINDITPWASIASLVLVGYAEVEFQGVLCGYLTDTYTSHESSANASLGIIRALLSGVFPLIGRPMFQNLGSNNALIILACVATAFCGIAALFGLYGKQIRQRSAFAEKMSIGHPVERPEWRQTDLV